MEGKKQRNDLTNQQPNSQDQTNCRNHSCYPMKRSFCYVLRIWSHAKWILNVSLRLSLSGIKLIQF